MSIGPINSPYLLSHWIYGELEGHFERKNGFITLSKALIRSARYTGTPPIPSPEQLSQLSLSNGWIDFDNSEEKINEQNKIYQIPLKNLVIRQYNLKTIRVHGDTSYGHISGIIWAKVAPPQKRNHWKAILFGILALILLLLNTCQPQGLVSERPIFDWKRIFSPTLPLPNDAKIKDEHSNKITTGKGDTKTRNGAEASEKSTLGKFYDESDINSWGCDKYIKINSDLLFDYDRSTLKPAAYDEIRQLEPFFQQVKENNLSIKITGHTDSFGDEQYNLRLSLRRAERIARWLVAENYLTSNQVVSEGKGENNLIIPAEKSKSEQAANRRVEICLICGPDGIRIRLVDEEGKEILSENKELPVKLLEQEPVTIVIPGSIKLDDAIKEPEIFLNSCGKPLLLSSDLLFDFDRATLRPQAINELEKIAKILKGAEDPNIKLKIVGHTDSIGSAKHNLRLSERRAKRVAQWLIDSKSTRNSQLIIEGKGEKQLLIPIGADNNFQRLNRRVEILVICHEEALINFKDGNSGEQ